MKDTVRIRKIRKWWMFYIFIAFILLWNTGCGQVKERNNYSVKIERDYYWHLPFGHSPIVVRELHQKYQDKIRKRLRPEYDPQNVEAVISVSESEETATIIYVDYSDLSQKDQQLIKGKLKPDAKINERVRITVGNKVNIVESIVSFDDLILEEQAKFKEKHKDTQENVVIAVRTD